MRRDQRLIRKRGEGFAERSLSLGVQGYFRLVDAEERHRRICRGFRRKGEDGQLSQSAALPIRRDERAGIGKKQFELSQEVFVGQRRTPNIVSLTWYHRQNVRKKDSHFVEQVDKRRL